MKKKLLLSLCAMIMACTLSTVSVAARTWEDVDTWEEFRQAFAEDTDGSVVIVLSGDIVSDRSRLETNEGQIYTINGNTYVLTDIIFGGSGRVTVNGDLQSDVLAAVEACDEVHVTVNGDLSGNHGGVYAADGATVAVNGNIDTGDSAIVSFDYANVYVNGDVSGEDIGVNAAMAGRVVVDGNVSGENSGGIWAYEGAEVTVNGNVTSENGNGIQTDYYAEVTVNGDVSGGENGIEASRQTHVTVDGNVSGGNGVYMEATADVHVTGDVTGADTADDGSRAGHGAYIVLSLEKVEEQDIHINDDGEKEVIIAGSLIVEGVVAGGDATGIDSQDGAAVYYAADSQSEFLEEDVQMNIAAPEVTVWGMETADEAPLYASDLTDSMTDVLGGEVNYIVRVLESEGGMVTADKDTAKAGETVVITPEAQDGYMLSKVMVSGTEMQPVNGVYSFVMPQDGKVEVSAVFEKIVMTDALNASPETADTSPLTGTAVMMLLSAAVAGGIMIRKKKLTDK